MRLTFLEYLCGLTRWGWQCLWAGLRREKGMNDNLIDSTPLRDGWGVCWQGGFVDCNVYDLPGPLVIVNLNKGEVDDGWIKGPVTGVLSLPIDDSPTACLPDNQLIGFVDSGITLLQEGINLYIHCAAGVSRSSYYDLALHIRAMNVPYDVAFAYLKARRPEVAPNPGFIAQLKRMESVLRATYQNP